MDRKARPHSGTADLVDAALSYAGRGWHVFPVKGKAPHPMLGKRGGHNLATTDYEQIKAWWGRDPRANIGVACEQSGLVVLDVDVGEGKVGDETLASLVGEHGALPPTVESVSGGGGRHLLFALNGDRRVPGRLGKNVDVKHAGYIVAPPSVHPDTGEKYRWVDNMAPGDRDLAHMPGAWMESERSSTEGDADWTVAEGERHDRFVSIAGTLRHNLAMSTAEIEEALHIVSPRFGTAPDRDEHIAQVARSMAKYPPGKVPWKVRFGREEGEAASRLQLLTLGEAFRAAEEEVDWVVPDLLAASEKAVIAGPPKSLKTWLALHLLRSVSVGEAVLGEEAWHVRDPQPVLFVQEEGSRQRWAQRLAMVFEDAPDAPLHYTHRGGFSLLSKAHVEWVIENAQQVGARLIVIDPWQRVTPGIKENDAADTGPAWDAVHRIASETGAAVVVVHHANKGGGSPSMDAIRGSSRMAGEVDLIVVMRKEERGRLEVFLDGRDLVRDDVGGNLEVEYEGDHPHRMRSTGFKVTIGGAKNVTREAVIAVLERAAEALTTTQVGAGVKTHLGEDRARQTIDEELHVLADEGKATKTASGKGKATYWEWTE